MNIAQLATLKQDTKKGQKDVLQIAIKYLEATNLSKKEILINALIERAKVGLEKYKLPLQTDNGHIPLIDVYQELLDAFMYAIQHTEEEMTNIYLSYRILEVLEYVIGILENDTE